MWKSQVISQWMEVGFMERARNLLVRQFWLRYHKEPSDELLAQIEQVTEPDTLERAFDAVVTAPTADEFEAILHSGNN